VKSFPSPCSRGSDEESEAVSDLGEGQPEYKLLRASIKDTLDIAPSKDSRFRSLKNATTSGKVYGILLYRRFFPLTVHDTLSVIDNTISRLRKETYSRSFGFS